VNARIDRPVFEVGGRTVAWPEVVADAEARGSVSALARRVGARGEGDDAATRAEAVAFRRARGLIAAEDLEAWLAHWGITTAEWMAWCRGQAAGPAPSAGPAPEPAEPAEPADVEPRLWPAAVCDGSLAAWARRLATSLAAGGDDAVALLREQAGSPQAVARELQARHLDWTRVDAELLALDTEDMAREAVLCLANDGLSPAEVAAAAGVEAERADRYVEDLSPALQAALIGARPGDVLAPVADGPVFVTGIVRRRVTPSADDPVTVARAAHALADRAVRRLLDEQVRWLDAV
jgi:hypothetical protein